MYNRTDWKDHIVERPHTYKETTNSDGSITHVEAPGTILQQGTPMNADNFNNNEEGTHAANIESMENFLRLRAHEQRMNGIDDRDASHEKEFAAEVQTVTMTNSSSYPFNNSKKTVALETVRKTLNYTVEIEITTDVANIGNIQVTDKQLNGFKIAFDGSAKSVTAKLTIKGGFLA